MAPRARDWTAAVLLVAPSLPILLWLGVAALQGPAGSSFWQAVGWSILFAPFTGAAGIVLAVVVYGAAWVWDRRSAQVHPKVSQ